MKNIFNNRRFKHGSLATIITIGFILLVIIVNIVATLLLERFPLEIDLTADNRFKLTQDSVDYIEKLPNKVKMTVCFDELEFKALQNRDEGEFYKQIYEIITSYSKYNKNIELDFVDLQKNPTFAQKYPGENLQAADIIIESGTRIRKVGTQDLLSQEQTESGGVVYGSQAEQVMTSAIMYVSNPEQTKISVLGGLNNADITQYIELMKKNNYEVIQQNFQTEEIDPKVDMIVLSAPDADISKDQLKKLNDFLDNDGKFGKSMVFIADFNRPVKPILASFLAEWGMEVVPAIAYETNANNILDNNPTVMINKLTNDDIINKLKTNELPLIVANVSPIKTLFTENDNRKTSVIAASSDTNIMVPADAVQGFDLTKLPKEMVQSIVMGTREKYVGSDLKQSKVVAFGSSAMFKEQYLLYAGFNNASVAITTTNLLTDKEDAVTILPVQFGEEAITITQAQANMFSAVFKFIIPVIVLILGIVVWLRRRHL